MPTTPQRPGRLLEIDALRGLAAMAVVLFHFTRRFVELFAPAQPPSLIATHGDQGVNLFFIISGFVIFMTLERTRRPMDFVVSRFSRLFPTYWCAIALTFTLTHLLALPIKTVTLPQALANIIMIHGLFRIPNVDGVYWTLQIELLFYFWMFMLFRLGWLNKVAYYLAAMLTLRIVYVAMSRYANIDLSWTASNLLILDYLPWFGLGIAIYRAVHPIPGFESRHSLVLAGAAVATLAYAEDWTAGLLAVVLGTAVWGAAAGRLRWLRMPLLVWLGAISYPLYLVHENIGWAVQLRVIRLGLSTNISVLIAFAVALALAAGLHHWVEQPALDAIRRSWRTRFARSPTTPMASDRS